MKKGQIALIVLVVSAVVLTVGLSVSRKSVVETKITTDEELLKQAFNAAESGVDYFLGTGKTNFTSTDSKSIANVAVNNIGGGTNIVNLGMITLRNKNSYTWMVDHNADGSLNLAPRFGATAMSVCVEDGFTGDLLIAYFYTEGGIYKVSRVFNNSVAVLPACSGVSGMGKGLSLDSLLAAGKNPVLLVVKPIIDDTKVAVLATGGVFPTQEVQISSTGKAGDVTDVSGTQVKQKVNVINQYQIPSFMLDAVTATGNVLSN